MTPRRLDEQSLIARQQQIIDASVALIENHGIENLTIDKVIAKVPFSKGTVYKHFVNKEDLLIAISNRSISILSDLFYRAVKFQGCSRVRMLLLNISYLIFAILHPVLFKVSLCSRTQNVRGKSSVQQLLEQKNLESKLLGCIHGIVKDALEDTSLTLPNQMDIQQICFALRSFGHGTISLLSEEVYQFNNCSGLIIDNEIFNQSNLLFDGLNWKPLNENKDYAKALRSSLKQVYPAELALLKQRGRELLF